MRRPLGPVAVFGASNFPLAFSVAGGDTASALAAGNPVIVKAHPAHPGTCERVGRGAQRRSPRGGSPRGDLRPPLRRRPRGREPPSSSIRGSPPSAFTGSRARRRGPDGLAAGRPNPSPSTPRWAASTRSSSCPEPSQPAGQLAAGLHASFTLGAGQFCTNPGVVLVEEGAAGDAFLAALAGHAATTAAGAMLTPGIREAYQKGQDRLAALGAERVAQGSEGTPNTATAAVWQVPAARVAAHPQLLDEVFGPSTLAVRYKKADLLPLLRRLEGNLTATLHAEPDELREAAPLLRLLESKAGRLLINQFPTGVEVCPAMVHGGPFPATSDGRTTSVGTRSIERFTRFVAYQGFPQYALPPELQDANPLGIRRMVKGEHTAAAL